MPKRDKKVSDDGRENAETLPDRALMLSQIQETVPSTPENPAVPTWARSRAHSVDKNGFALPKPDRRWLH